MMDRVLGQLKWTTALIYIDDVLLYASSFEELVERLDLVLTASGNYGLTYKPSKCSFGLKRLKFLGHIISAKGYEVDPKEVRSIREFPQPEICQKVKSFLGLCNYYRKYIARFAHIAAPLYQMTNGLRPQDKVSWTKEGFEAFEDLKEKLATAPVLHFVKEGAQIQIITDASGYGIAGV